MPTKKELELALKLASQETELYCPDNDPRYGCPFPDIILETRGGCLDYPAPCWVTVWLDAVRKGEE